MKMNSIVPCTVYRVRVDCCVRNSYRGKPIVLPPPAEASSAAPSLSSRKMTNPPKSASGLLHSRLVLMDRLLLLTTSDVCGRVRPLVTASAMRCSRELAFLILLLSTRSVTELWVDHHCWHQSGWRLLRLWGHHQCWWRLSQSPKGHLGCCCCCGAAWLVRSLVRIDGCVFRVWLILQSDEASHQAWV